MEYADERLQKMCKTPGKYSFFQSGFCVNSRQYLNFTNRTITVFLNLGLMILCRIYAKKKRIKKDKRKDTKNRLALSSSRYHSSNLNFDLFPVASRVWCNSAVAWPPGVNKVTDSFFFFPRFLLVWWIWIFFIKCHW